MDPTKLKKNDNSNGSGDHGTELQDSPPVSPACENNNKVIHNRTLSDTLQYTLMDLHHDNQKTPARDTTTTANSSSTTPSTNPEVPANNKNSAPKSIPSSSVAASKDSGYAIMDRNEISKPSLDVNPYMVMSPSSEPHEVPSSEYEMMSPVSVDLDKTKRNNPLTTVAATASETDSTSLPSPTPLSAIEERLGGAILPGTPVHFRSGSETLSGSSGAKPKGVNRNVGSKRSSFCSENDRWSPTPNWDLGVPNPVLDYDGDIPLDHPDYVPIDYSQRNSAGRIPTSASIPIGSSLGNRMSPASSSSLVSGTPHSAESRFPMQKESISYLRDDDDEEDAKTLAATSATSPTSLPGSSGPMKAFAPLSGDFGNASNSAQNNSGSSNSSKDRDARSRTNSITSRFIDIPSGSRKKDKGHSPGASQYGKTPPSTGYGASSLLGQSPNPLTRWFRSRTGSVPSKPPISGRRRHRTQSEGEKDSPENHEEAEKQQARN